MRRRTPDFSLTGGGPGSSGEAPARRFRGRRGFTLLEVVLALMLTGMVLVATTFFIFSMGELWGRGVEDRLFDRHARGVSRFLQSALSQSMASANPAEPGRISLSQPPGIGRFDESLITFELLEGPPFLVWPGAPLPAVVCYLKLVEGEGLFLLWHSRLEVDFEEQAPRGTLLSPFVTELIYDYYDPETELWTSLPEFENDDKGEPSLPTRVRLVFAYDGMIKETILTLPQPSASIALF